VSARSFGFDRTACNSGDRAIAATALELSTPLATVNVRHFPMFEGLRSPY